MNLCPGSNERTADAWLAERLMACDSDIYAKLQGMYRTSDQYVNSPEVAHALMEVVGVREVIEMCVLALERRTCPK